ncbi:hypothetical protein [uncultured Alistipes sp.]|uniref:hypothetical protein n=1 Tax=uncultured Alistipes sp. TaxID=538949 RepID=UPI0026E0C762|nr:hypothetical protein [uncultured Alistipes sp.]
MIGLKESTSVTSLYREFSLSLSKAMGCKQVHDDRIAGVTFVENASRNALIVDKEYVWAGNPFPNPKQKGESSGILPSAFVCRCMRNSAHATSKRPFQGPGMSVRIRGNARAQRKCKCECESRFPLQNRREESKRFFPLLHIGTVKPISTTSECTFREEIWPTQRAIAEPTRNTGLPFHSKGPQQSNPKVFF